MASKHLKYSAVMKLYGSPVSIHLHCIEKKCDKHYVLHWKK